MTRQPLLEVVEEIEFRYPGDDQHRYRIPSGLRLFAGEAWCLSGISGSGKTTLMTLLASLRRFQRGRIRYRFPDAPPIEVSPGSWRSVVGPRLWRRLGFSFQRPELIRSLSVAANLEIVGSASEANLFSQTEWQSIASSRVWQISGGQIQRLGLMRAFGDRQALVFLDEPTNNLDIDNRKAVLDFVRSQRDQRGLIAVSHDADFLEGLEVDRQLRVEETMTQDGGVDRALHHVAGPSPGTARVLDPVPDQDARATRTLYGELRP